MQSSQPLVSILINNYNYDRFLGAAIESAKSQTYLNTEIIVVDDGSSDCSSEIISNYSDSVIAILKSNGGQASAFNAGFAVSKGDWICILDADDLWVPTKVEQVMEVAKQHQNAAVIYHKVQNIDEQGHSLGCPWPPYAVIQGNVADQVTSSGGWWPFPPSTGLSFSRSFLNQVMDIPEEKFPICADTYWADLAPFFGDVVGLEEALSFFRLHTKNNWSHSNDLKQRSLQYHETRVQVLNQALAKLGHSKRVDLANNLPYQRLRYQLSQGTHLGHLSHLEWRNPWEKRLKSRAKSLLRWYLSHGIKRLKLVN